MKMGSAGNGGDGSVQRAGSVIYDCLVGRGGFRHVQHVRPNRGPHKKGAPQEDLQIFATEQRAGNN